MVVAVDSHVFRIRPEDLRLVADESLLLSCPWLRTEDGGHCYSVGRQPFENVKCGRPQGLPRGLNPLRGPSERKTSDDISSLCCMSKA